MKSKLDYTIERVYENKRIDENVYQLEVQGNFKGIPGQFYMLRCWDMEPVLWRPISIHYLNEEKIVFLYQITGRGTRKLGNLKKGDEIKLLGPLGNGFFTNDIIKKNIAIIAGGIGIAPMFYLAKDIRKQISIDSIQFKDYKLDLYAGFKDSTYSIEKFQPFADNIYVSTETGSAGKKGYVTDGFNPENYNMVVCCGPQVMMKKVVNMCSEKQVTVYVSMENRMACGIGACLVCTCNTINGNKRVCRDGPVFLGTDIMM
ncbi:dihydroorotate dehydrogenase electron transfer subunit [Clostridium sp. WILCCON 0269]|uniref:Dihydroorotate dehydrogenase B (NAD(+)), electron transfer subunit n=1 Tax=Candidatus Clostridium eludens TaxID=3381663 RepID=A0ABW8SEW1_9CLOT